MGDGQVVTKKAIAELESIVEEMTLQELIALRKSLDERISNKQEQERERFISEMKERAEQLGFDLGTMFGVAPPQRRARGSSSSGAVASPRAKYRDPATGATWSGRGRMAGWLAFHVEEALAKGVSKERTLEKFLIKE
jgi:DNA-binding protein H-NS